MNMKIEYENRLKRVADAVALREPDRVPLVPVMEGFPVFYGGGTIQDCIYDVSKAGPCYDKFFTDYKPDLGWDPIMMYPARFMEIAGLNWFRWPGKHIEDPNVLYQYIEDEYMKEDEYTEAIYDITKFMMNKWMPRSFSNLQGLAKLDFRNSMWFGSMGTVMQFADPQVIATMKAAAEAGQVLVDFFNWIGEYGKKMKTEFGMPVAYGGFAYAPFDMIGDTMRGTSGILQDLYDRPDEVLELVEKVTDFAIRDCIAGAKASGRPWVWYWLHKGIDQFMSDEMFKKFYWPTLRRYITEVAEAGLVPMVYVEGAYNTRLNYLTEVPRGKVVYLFETIDMREAKRVLKDTACIAGNVPNAMLTWGTSQEVTDYCKELIDICAPGGGYMMDSGALIDEAKPENVTAMFETTMTYGKY
jgi:hypothetical protein